jgi:hypothetical protein
MRSRHTAHLSSILLDNQTCPPSLNSTSTTEPVAKSPMHTRSWKRGRSTARTAVHHGRWFLSSAGGEDDSRPRWRKTWRSALVVTLTTSRVVAPVTPWPAWPLRGKKDGLISRHTLTEGGGGEGGGQFSPESVRGERRAIADRADVARQELLHLQYGISPAVTLLCVGFTMLRKACSQLATTATDVDIASIK